MKATKLRFPKGRKLDPKFWPFKPDPGLKSALQVLLPAGALVVCGTGFAYGFYTEGAPTPDAGTAVEQQEGSKGFLGKDGLLSRDGLGEGLGSYGEGYDRDRDRDYDRGFGRGRYRDPYDRDRYGYDDGWGWGGSSSYGGYGPGGEPEPGPLPNPNPGPFQPEKPAPAPKPDPGTKPGGGGTPGGGSGTGTGGGQETPVPLPSFPAGFADGMSGVVGASALPTDEAQAKVLWTKNVVTDGEHAVSGTYGMQSTALAVDGKVYKLGAASDGTSVTLYRFDAKTGKADSVKLSAKVGYNPQLAAAGGYICIPLADGGLAAVDGTSFKQAWTAPAPATGLASNAGLAYDEATGTVYHVPSKLDGTWTAASGYLVGYDVKTGKERSRTELPHNGCYWTAPLVRDGHVYLPTDQGSVLDIVPGSSAAPVSHDVAPGAKLRSRLTSVGGGEFVVSASNGTLHKLAIGGGVSARGSVSFASGSTSTPTFADGLVFVGGNTAAYQGVVAVISASDLAVKATVADAALLPGAVQASPLVATRDGHAAGAWVTSNNKPGALLFVSYDAARAAAAVAAVFTPQGADANYDTATPVAVPGVGIFYANDSATLVALGAK